jgi:hypothetical protein
MNMPVEDVEESDGFFRRIEERSENHRPCDGSGVWLTLWAMKCQYRSLRRTPSVATIKGLRFMRPYSTPRLLGKTRYGHKSRQSDIQVGRYGIDGDVLQWGGGSGYMTADISDPTQPKLLGTSA